MQHFYRLCPNVSFAYQTHNNCQKQLLYFAHSEESSMGRKNNYFIAVLLCILFSSYSSSTGSAEISDLSDTYRKLWADPKINQTIENNIETFRKDNAVIRTCDEQQNPLPDVSVTVEQANHEFPFGCNLGDGMATRGENRLNGGLIDENMVPKKSYQVLDNLINTEWNTNERGKTDENGTFLFRVFSGM